MQIKTIRHLALLCITLLSFRSIAQVNWIWTKQADSAREFAAYDAVDRKNNAYYTGSFTLGPRAAFGNISLTLKGSQNDFLVKYDPNGNPLWARNGLALSNSVSSVGAAVATDRNNSVIETGSFSDSIAFGTYHLNANRATFDPFVVKYDANGNALWAHCPSLANSLDQGNYVATDLNNNVFATGFFQDTIIFGTDTFTAANRNMFLVKYDANGNLLWATAPVLQNSSSASIGNCVATDSKGNVYVGGLFNGDATFGVTDISSAAGEVQVFLAKYDPLGNLIWVLNIPAQTGAILIPTAFTPLNLLPTPICVDKSNHIYISSQFTNSSMTIGPSTITDDASASLCSNSLLAKYDNNGNPLWATCCRFVSTAEVCVIVESSVAIDHCDNVYWSGVCSDTFAVGKVNITVPGAGASPSTPFAYIMQLDSNGNALAGAGLANQNEIAYSNGIALDSLSRVLFDQSLDIPTKMVVGNDTVKEFNSDATSFISKFSVGPVAKSSNDSICHGDSTILSVTPSAGASYVWSTGETTSSIKVKPIITTQYYVAINSGCYIDTSYIKVNVNPVPVVTIIPPHDTICLGSVTTLTGSGAVSYTWAPGNYLSCVSCVSTNASPTTTTTYTVTGTNSHGCSDTQTIKLVVRPIPPHTVTAINPIDTICRGDSVNLSASGGVSYLWNPGNSTASSIWEKPSASATYSLTITFTTCNFDTAIVIRVKQLPVINVTPADTAICRNDSVTLTATGGGTYKWSNNATTKSIRVSPTANATYTVVVSNGCKDSTTASITVTQLPAITLTTDQSICKGDSVTLKATGGGTYKWSNNSTNSSIKVSPSSNTTYKVVVSNGCKDSGSTKVFVRSPFITACCDTTIIQGNSVHLSSSLESSYSWAPAAGLSCTTCADPIASPTITTIYTLTAIDTDGCPIEKTVTIKVLVPCSDFEVPTVFTPNNDGINDDFVIKIINATSYNITIYDRWGKQVYTSSNLADYWNGTCNGTSNLVPDGTYFYVITTHCDNTDYSRKGFVQVLGEK